MKIAKYVVYLLTFTCLGSILSCDSGPNTNPNPGTSKRQTAQLAQLADTAFKATLKVANPPEKMRSGEKLTVNVNVQNTSPDNWPALGEQDARFAITLRNRWLSSDEKKVINDLDGGASLPYDLPPGSSTDMNIRITAPAEPGDYILEFDMVQERVTWFRDKGSQATRLKMKVEP